MPEWAFIPDVPDMSGLDDGYARRWLENSYSNTPNPKPLVVENSVRYTQEDVSSAIQPARFPPQRSHWIEIHEHVWVSLESSKNFFEDWWSRKPVTCNCKGADQILADNPMQFDSAFAFFESGVLLHNAVSSKPELSKTHPRFSIEQALHKWKPELWPSQPRMNVTAITSLSPLPGHQDVQRLALESWKKFGLDVISVNLEHEIPALQAKFPDMEFRLGKPSENYDRPTPTIRSMLDQCTDGNYLLINSDCALYGPQSYLSGSPAVLIRHNWTNKPSDAVQEQWGLDAFYLTSEMAKTVPDLPFAIGKPMWDYWIAWHLEKYFDLCWVGDPLVYHKLHPINWRTEECTIGKEWLENAYGEKVDWIKWRNSRPFAYSHYADWKSRS